MGLSWRLRSRFQHDRATGEQRRCDLVGNLRQWSVPGYNGADDANWFANK